MFFKGRRMELNPSPFSQTAKRLATGSLDTHVCLWDGIGPNACRLRVIKDMVYGLTFLIQVALSRASSLTVPELTNLTLIVAAFSQRDHIEGAYHGSEIMPFAKATCLTKCQITPEIFEQVIPRLYTFM